VSSHAPISAGGKLKTLSAGHDRRPLQSKVAHIFLSGNGASIPLRKHPRSRTFPLLPSINNAAARSQHTVAKIDRLRTASPPTNGTRDNSPWHAASRRALHCRVRRNVTARSAADRYTVCSMMRTLPGKHRMQSQRLGSRCKPQRASRRCVSHHAI